MGVFDITFFSLAEHCPPHAVSFFLEASTTGEPENYFLVMGLPSLH